jgi:hypothetical protein
MAARLNSRVMRLERVIAPPADSYTCRRCGLCHVRPLTMDLARRLIGPMSVMAPGAWRDMAEHPVPPLCLCDPCCSEPADRWLARRSHGLPSEGEA